jgi:hypothetical protein
MCSSAWVHLSFLVGEVIASESRRSRCSELRLRCTTSKSPIVSKWLLCRDRNLLDRCLLAVPPDASLFDMYCLHATRPNDTRISSLLTAIRQFEVLADMSTYAERGPTFVKIERARREIADLRASAASAEAAATVKAREVESEVLRFVKHRVRESLGQDTDRYGRALESAAVVIRSGSLFVCRNVGSKAGVVLYPIASDGRQKPEGKILLSSVDSNEVVLLSYVNTVLATSAPDETSLLLNMRAHHRLRHSRFATSEGAVVVVEAEAVVVDAEAEALQAPRKRRAINPWNMSARYF